MMKKVFGFLGVCLWVGYVIIGIAGWQYMSTTAKMIIAFNALILSALLLIKLLIKIHLIRLIIKVEKENIPNLQRGLRRVHMYEYTRGRDYAKYISEGEVLLCEMTIEKIKHIKSQIIMPFIKKSLDNKIKDVEEIKNQMAFLR